MTPKVIDLSHHNIVSDFDHLKEQGIIGIVHKATEGTDFTDPKLKARHYLTREAGLLWGLYHFLRPFDPTAQATYFLAQTTQLRDNQTLIAVDYEDPTIPLAALKTFMAAIRRMTGRQPIIYAGNVLKEKLAGRPDPELSDLLLWLADHGVDYTMPPGFPSVPYMRQYTDSGVISGIQGMVDLNEIFMPDERFSRIWRNEPLLEPSNPTWQNDPLHPPAITLTVPKGTKVSIVEV